MNEHENSVLVFSAFLVCDTTDAHCLHRALASCAVSLNVLNDNLRASFRTRKWYRLSLYTILLVVVDDDHLGETLLILNKGLDAVAAARNGGAAAQRAHDARVRIALLPPAAISRFLRPRQCEPTRKESVRTP